MDVRPAYEISSFADLKDGAIFVTDVEGVARYCIKTFDQFEGGNRNTHFTVLGAVDGKKRQHDFEIVYEDLGPQNVLGFKNAELAVSLDANAYSFKQIPEHELGVIFIEGNHHLGVRQENGGRRLLVILESGELTQGPSEQNIFAVREWKLDRPSGPKRDDVQEFPLADPAALGVRQV